MIKVLFVCHGNICRSTMAEFVFKDLIAKAGMAEQFFVDSAATSRDAIGCSVDSRTKRTLAKHDVPCGEHYAKQITKADYESFDHILIMDHENLRGIERIIKEDPDNKIHFLLEYTRECRDVADPWYTDDFETAYDDILNGCRAFFDHVTCSDKACRKAAENVTKKAY